MLQWYMIDSLHGNYETFNVIFWYIQLTCQFQQFWCGISNLSCRADYNLIFVGVDKAIVTKMCCKKITDMIRKLKNIWLIYRNWIFNKINGGIIKSQFIIFLNTYRNSGKTVYHNGNIIIINRFHSMNLLKLLIQLYHLWAQICKNYWSNADIIS